jgi:hypothetical protein
MNDRAEWAGSEGVYCDATLRHRQRPEGLLMR